jgi:putative hydrolase of HD superfamily
MALLMTDSTLDKTKVVKMALVHDLAECKVGDITPFDGVSVQDKHQQERKAMDDIVDMLNHSPEALELKELWMEYEEAKTPEALLCKDLDKFEVIYFIHSFDR